MSRLFHRIKQIYKNEGSITLLKKMSNAMIWLLYEYSTLYLQVNTVKTENEAEFIPRMEGLISMIIKRSCHIDDLIERGFDLALLDIRKAKSRLNKGAILIALFINNEFAYQSWLALSDKAKRSITPYPLKVNYTRGEVFSGDAWTNPKYRRRGLHNYGGYKRHEFLRNNKLKYLRSTTLTDNTASIASNTKHGTKIIAKAYYLRLFGLRFWREAPVK